jgi:hypothetical protein
MKWSTKVPVRGRVVLGGIRFARDVVSSPSAVVTVWKTATGGKAVGCFPGTPVPELLHAANLFPIVLESPGDLSLVSDHIDAWLVGTDSSPFSVPPDGKPRFTFPCVPPVSVEDALDRVEALTEWAGAVSGTPVSEGGLWNSIREHATRQALFDALYERCSREPAFLTPDECNDIVRAAHFLPPDAHSRLLSSILGVDSEPAVVTAEGERGDPLIVLAKRIVAG